MASDIEIAKKATLKPITEIAAGLGVDIGRIELYGHHKAKLPLDLIDHQRIENSNRFLFLRFLPHPLEKEKRQSRSVCRKD